MTGQAAIETLMAVFLLMGVFVVISLISVQRTDINRQFTEQDQNAALCTKISILINQAGSFAGNVRMGFFLDRPAWIEKGAVRFGGAGGYYCYYLGRVEGDDAPTPIALTAGYYTVTKESGVISIAQATPPS
jgi:hypothetical protein